MWLQGGRYRRLRHEVGSSVVTPSADPGGRCSFKMQAYGVVTLQWFSLFLFHVSRGTIMESGAQKIGFFSGVCHVSTSERTESTL